MDALGQVDQHHAQASKAQIFRRPEGFRHLRQRRRYEHQADDGNRSGDKGTEGSHAEGRSRSSLQCHLMAVETGDHCGRLSRDIDQDRSRRSSVHGPVVNPGQHDDRRNRRDVKGAGQKEGNGGRGPQSGLLRRQ